VIPVIHHSTPGPRSRTDGVNGEKGGKCPPKLENYRLVRGECQRRGPRLCRVPVVFRTWYHQVGARIGGLQASPPRRGMRTTLVNGVLTLNEVETFLRHHVQRRAHPVYLRAGATVKQNLPGPRPPNRAAAAWRQGARRCPCRRGPARR